MKPEASICTNCIHHIPKKRGRHECSTTKYLSVIDGMLRYQSCWAMRSHAGPCGPEGSKFETKNRTFCLVDC